ncbi:hypothetical protein AVEN_32351-1 [Araneus ventricosus]|uniref:Uncharacterized protein n=1 Tax=Araneus ventricosus TaxID=182803 RepID=A0A4Y2FM68_ARAVE|nr:hypothetical protein AVEN_32351-1 [Araneus ventricosus]
MRARGKEPVKEAAFRASCARCLPVDHLKMLYYPTSSNNSWALTSLPVTHPSNDVYLQLHALIYRLTPTSRRQDLLKKERNHDCNPAFAHGTNNWMSGSL